MSEERSYGTLKLDRGAWWLAAEPHVVMMAKRLWKRTGGVGTMKIEATAPAAVDLAWFLSRYPLEMTEGDRATLEGAAATHQEHIRRVADYLGQHLPPPAFDLAIPAREYQAREAAALLEQGHLLVADEVGLGKSLSGIIAMTDPRALPAVVVTLTHLPHQWVSEIKKFAPRLRTHILRNGDLYPLDGSRDRQRGLLDPPDVIVTSYSKLAKWGQILAAYAKYIVFDEIQNLARGGGSGKYQAALAVAGACKFRMGLSATPVNNYGDEIFNVLAVLAPGSLGTHTEFVTEWCTPISNGRYKFRQPAAFGSWAREQGLIVRHTRKEVGRELPDVIVCVEEIDAEANRLEEIEGRAAELARILMRDTEAIKGDKLMAGGELERIVRQATGLAKAPFVAEFVRILVESGERVLLAGWHHAVYDLWEERLAGLRVVRYTGQQSIPEKTEAARKFLDGEADVMMISLRAGAGLDGLQKASRVVVFGELDWSPGVHEQVVGRLRRDGQADPVVAYYLCADSGSDPIMMNVLGIKRQQATGIVDPTRPAGELFAQTDTDRTRLLAEAWLSKKGGEW